MLHLRPDILARDQIKNAHVITPETDILYGKTFIRDQTRDLNMIRHKIHSGSGASSREIRCDITCNQIYLYDFHVITQDIFMGSVNRSR